jgi:integrase
VDEPNGYNRALAKAKMFKGQPTLSGIGTWQADMEEYLEYRVRQKEFVPETVRGTRHVLEKFFQNVGKTTIADITYEDAKRYFENDVVQRDTSRRTHFARLSGFVSWALENQKVPEHFLKKVKVKRPPAQDAAREDFLDDSEIRAVIDYAKEEYAHDLKLRFILYMGFHMGLRKKEISFARCENFILGDREIASYWVTGFEDCDGWSFNTKNKKRRVIKIGEEFYNFLMDEYTFAPRQIWALEGGTGRKGVYRYEWRDRFNTFMKRALEERVSRYGLNITPHSMRHSFITSAIRKAIPIGVVARQSGCTISTIDKHYFHYLVQEEEKAVF